MSAPFGRRGGRFVMPSSEWTIGYVLHARRAQRSLAFVAAAIVTIACIFTSPPNLRAQLPARLNEKAARPAGDGKRAVTSLEPFGVSLMPVKANCIVAFRPAAILQRDEMKRYAKALRDWFWWNVDPEGILEPKRRRVKLETIEQIT